VVVASFTYDADGKRVKSVMDGETTLFVGAHYEVKNGNQITQYYLAGTTRVTMRKYTIPQNMSVEYLLSDHLGSTSLTTDANGAKVLELRYKAWGEVRATWTANPTTTPAYRSPAYTYTGQYSYMDDPTTSGVTEGFGLMFYNARWYDPALGRFAQADTMIPSGVQGMDRYAYANNSPIIYTDPTGHTACDEIDSNGNCLTERDKTNSYIDDGKSSQRGKIGNDGYYWGCNSVAGSCTDFYDYSFTSSSAIDLGQLFNSHFSITDLIANILLAAAAPEVEAPVGVSELAAKFLPRLVAGAGEAIAKLLPSVFPTVGDSLIDAGQTDGGVTVTLVTDLKEPVYGNDGSVIGLVPSSRFALLIEQNSSGRTQPIYIQGVYLPEVKYVLDSYTKR
jgi:RHS repeat-associated protein